MELAPWVKRCFSTSCCFCRCSALPRCLPCHRKRSACSRNVAGRHACPAGHGCMALRAIRRSDGRCAVRDAGAMDPGMGCVLPDRSRWLQPAAGDADGFPRAAGGRRLVHGHPEGREAVLRDGVPHPVRHARGIRRTGPFPVLSVLGSDDDPDVFHHRHLGRRAPDLRHDQVRALHRLRQHSDARRGDLPRLFAQRDFRRDFVCLCRPVPRGAAAHDAGRAARRFRSVVRDQGADRASAHLAPRRARRSAHCGLGDPGRGTAQDGHLRFHETGLPAVSRRNPIAGAVLQFSGCRQHRLRRLSGAGANRYQEDHRLLVDQPPRLCDARADQSGSHRHPGRGYPNGEPWPGRGRALPARRHGLRALPYPRARCVRRAGQS